jgi:hypothetical protein
MPYKIKETKDKKFSVVNKDTGRVMSKGTTKTKAEKQIKAIYTNMKPEHRIRHRISLLEGRSISNPLHRNIINLARHLLKQEEIHGNGFWDDAWSGIKQALALPAQLVSQVPFLEPALEYAFPEITPFLGTIKGVSKALYGDDTNQWLTDFLGVASADPYYKGSKPAPQPLQAPAPLPEEQDEGDVEDEQTQNAKHTEDFDKVIEHISNQVDIEDQEAEQEEGEADAEAYAPRNLIGAPTRDIYGQIIAMDDALRFPMVYNYDENNRPQYLQEFLLTNGVAGHNFAVNEYGNTYKNQRPYEFLNHPINGGKLRRLDFSSVGYSKKF